MKMSKPHICIKPDKKNCEWRDTILKDNKYCIILNKDKPCIEEEAIMEEKDLTMGKDEVVKFAEIIQYLTTYLDTAPTMDVMDRVNDACGHLRKAKILVEKHYQLKKEKE